MWLDMSRRLRLDPLCKCLSLQLSRSSDLIIIHKYLYLLFCTPCTFASCLYAFCYTFNGSNTMLQTVVLSTSLVLISAPVTVGILLVGSTKTAIPLAGTSRVAVKAGLEIMG